MLEYGRRYYREHINERREYNKRRYKENREKVLEYNKKWRRKNRARRRDDHAKWRYELRMKVFKHLSGDPPHCVLCGFSDTRALQIDHIRGGGLKERKKRNLSTIRSRIVNMPAVEARKDYQILCANCNYIKKMGNANERGGVKRSFV